MIEGVTFDWWHTVAETPWPDYDNRLRTLRVERIRDVLAAEGIVLEPDVLYAAYDQHTELLVRSWRDLVDLTAEEQMHAYLEFAGLDATDDHLALALQEAFGAAIRTKPPILYPHIAQTLARLKREGVRVGLVSNTGRTWGRFLRPLQDELGIGKYFDARVFSDEVRTRKPSGEIFETALDALQLEPQTVVHIGDDVNADVEGAKALGMRAIWFNAGFWPGAKTDLADAEIHDHEELFGVLARWTR